MFYSYEGISDDVLDKQHITSTGEHYTLRHNENLKVEMQYVGKGNSRANSQGWERNSTKYFDTLYHNHPEMFSKKNAARIKEGQAPIVDQKMITVNPGWAQYRNQPLVHHHIGGDGEAVAVPQNAHKGQGEIHNHEKAAGITGHCKSFSKTCAGSQESIGKTTSQLHGQFSNSNRSDAVKNSVNTSNSPESGGRKDVVRNALDNNGSVSQRGRSDSVRNSISSSAGSKERSSAKAALSTSQSFETSNSVSAAGERNGPASSSFSSGNVGSGYTSGSSGVSNGSSSGQGQSK